MNKIIITNKKVYYDYFVLEKFEAGIVLKGLEVKSIRSFKINIQNSYVVIKNSELFLEGVNIALFQSNSHIKYNSLRQKKILLKKKEIKKIIVKLKEIGISFVPISFYFNENGIIKVLLGLVKGKKIYDKRRILAKKEANKDMKRSLKKQYR